MAPCPKCGQPLGVRAGGGQYTLTGTCKHCSITVRANTLAGLTSVEHMGSAPGDATLDVEEV